MRSGLPVILSIILAATIVAAKDPELIPAPGPESETLSVHSEPCFHCCDCCDGGPTCWVGAEYLLWWVKDAPLPIPLSSVNTPPAFPIIGVPGNTILYGNNDQAFDVFSGGRITAGQWCNCDRTLGIEASGFLLQKNSAGFDFQSDGTVNVGIPFFDVLAGAENAFITAGAGGIEGGHTFTNTLQLWGAEANGLLNLKRTCNCEVNLLAGFRYLGLDESFGSINIFGPTDGFMFAASDRFATSNDFYGGQIGIRTTYRTGPWSVDAVAKVALGVNHGVVSISGFLIDGPVFTGGFLSQPTNIGDHTRDSFAVIPEAQIRIGYGVTENIRMTVGYDFLFSSSVLRPGDQIDRNINDSQIGGNPLIGPALPQPRTERSQFWAHGLSFGLECRW